MLADASGRSMTEPKWLIRKRLGTSRSATTPCQGGSRGFDPRFPLQTVAPRLREICAFGAPASDSAGCGLDRSPDPAQALRSRGGRLLPRLLRETTRAASLGRPASEDSRHTLP